MMNASGSDWIRLDVRHPELRTRPVLLSHCYADPELPLLREAGVYAVRQKPSIRQCGMAKTEHFP